MSEFGQTVRLFGEDIIYADETVRASLKYSTKAVFNLANRACYVEGQTCKTSPLFKVGEYFTRAIDGEKYLIVTVNPENMADDLVYLYGIKCNEKIIVKRFFEKQADEFGDLKDNYVTVASNLPIFRDFTLRMGKSTNDGIIDQGIYTMIVPHSYNISYGDTIIAKHNDGGAYKDTKFKVENVGNALADGTEGVDTLQLSLDIRE